MRLEACVETLEECVLAQERGAQQLELCGNLAEDGLTPPLELVRQVLQKISIPVKVMVRPRPGNFRYSEGELATMESDIIAFRALPIAGIVLGALQADQTIDLFATHRLAQLAGKLSVTFHKAIDATPDPVEAYRQLLTIPGITHVLSSGGASTAWEGRAPLKEMIRIGTDHIRVIPAGKILPTNLSELDAYLGAETYHGRRIVGSLEVL
ncbi:MAG: copper homeostasis protein CutC [Bacteroidota bacterium]